MQEALGADSGPWLTVSKKTRISALQLPVTGSVDDHVGLGMDSLPESPDKSPGWPTP